MYYKHISLYYNHQCFCDFWKIAVVTQIPLVEDRWLLALQSGHFIVGNSGARK